MKCGTKKKMVLTLKDHLPWRNFEMNENQMMKPFFQESFFQFFEDRIPGEK